MMWEARRAAATGDIGATLGRLADQRLALPISVSPGRTRVKATDHRQCLSLNFGGLDDRSQCLPGTAILPAMNSDTQILVDEILAKSGAVEKCSICHNYLIHAWDDDAEKMAYGMATNAWKSGERGFRGMAREEVLGLAKRALDSAPSKCPSCG